MVKPERSFTGIGGTWDVWAKSWGWAVAHRGGPEQTCRISSAVAADRIAELLAHSTLDIAEAFETARMEGLIFETR
jgi:hypothetical protein